jgi:branched-chain amino acid transport system ATP-binding protein
VLLSEQNLRFARRVADRACLLEQGHVVASGTLDAVQAQYALA